MNVGPQTQGVQTLAPRQIREARFPVGSLLEKYRLNEINRLGNMKCAQVTSITHFLFYFLVLLLVVEVLAMLLHGDDVMYLAGLALLGELAWRAAKR